MTNRTIAPSLTGAVALLIFQAHALSAQDLTIGTTAPGSAAPGDVTSADAAATPAIKGPDGGLYVTASHIQDTQWFTPGTPASITTELFAFDPVTFSSEE